ncbi:MAG TPA: DUF4112 domain-containing protein [Pyrinomonadaceae bacterium]|jgi:hypothetical protein|nr:DUF4112 domain-containing protein [Pyrinomonadaceae bacterium]
MRALKLEELQLERPRNQAGNVDQNIERLSWLMDDLFRIPVLGWRFGLDAIIGLIPAFGDTTTSLVSFYILASAVRYRVPKITLLRMGLNIAIDYVVGSVPVVGDLFDAWWKSNQMNVELLKRRALVSAEAETGKASDWLFVGAIIVGLIGLVIGSVALSVFLSLRLGQLIWNLGS